MEVQKSQKGADDIIMKRNMNDTGLLISHAFDEKGITYLPLYMTPLL